jgi:hypothetical protein
METIITTKNGAQKVNINRRKAIRLKCLDCSCFSYVEVTNCAFKNCPLFVYRKTGLRKAENSKSLTKNDAIRQISNTQMNITYKDSLII